MEAALFLPEGTMLGNRLRIDGLLSEGGGTSYLYTATDLRSDRKVAVKEFFPKGYCNRQDGHLKRPDSAQDLEIYRTAREMFIDEAALMRSLNGSGIAPEYLDLRYDLGTVFLVMEFIDGENLRTRLETYGGGMNAGKALRLARPVFESLMALHERRIIHRDVSPDNIMLCMDGGVRLIDFGNARMQEPGKSRVIDWAKKGYAPLEQQDAAFRQGEWTDVYALAATIWRMIAGEAPPSASARMSRDVLPVLPGMSGVTDAQKAALTRALALYPEARFQTMRAFYEALYAGEGKASAVDGSEGMTAPAQKQTAAVQKVTAPVESDAGHGKSAQGALPSAPGVTGWLLGLEGVYQGQEIATGLRMTIGRSASCTLRFPADTPGVSAEHLDAVFDTKTHTLIVTDKGSTFGTRLLSRLPVAKHMPVVLKEGEGFILGEHEIFAFFTKQEGEESNGKTE